MSSTCFNTSDKIIKGDYSTQQVIPFPKDQTYSKSPVFSYFRFPGRHKYSDSKINILEVFELIRSERFSEITSFAQGLNNQWEMDKFIYRKFQCVSFAGIFNILEKDRIQSYSELLALNFNRIKNPVELKKAILKDERLDVELMYDTPWRKGLYVIVSYNKNLITYEKFAKAVSKHVITKYDQPFIQDCLDVTRVSYLSYDPEVFLNSKFYK